MTGNSSQGAVDTSVAADHTTPAARGTRATPTLKDIAEAAGVSVSTVSRVLDDRNTASRSASAERIREAARSLGYRRNALASALRRGATGTVGVLVPRLTDAVMAMTYEALERAGLDRGYFTVVATSGDDPHAEAQAAETLLERNVEALILASVRADDPLPQHLREAQVPHVLAIRTDGISPSSLGDDELGGYLATRHLIDLGHEDIALVMGPDFASSAVDRLRGAHRALNEAGIDLRPDWLLRDGFRMENGVEAGRTLFADSKKDRPSAVFAANDNLAVGIMSVAHRSGLRVGRDVALVGYNDTPIASALSIPLTSVRVPFDRIAATAFDLLKTTDEKNVIRRATPTLIPRDSSGKPHR